MSHGFLPDYERGFCNGLAAHGIRVTLLGSDRTDVAGLDRSIQLINMRGSQDQLRPRWSKAWNLLRYNVRLLAYSARHRNAVIHVFGSIEPVVWYGIILGLWFRLLCRQYVLTVHNLLPHDRHTAFNRCGFRLAYRLPTRLVVHTDRMKQELGKTFAVGPGNIIVMQHGIEPVCSGSRGSRDVRTQGVPPTVLAFGRLAPYKGTDILLNALRYVSFDFRLIIAGPCPDEKFRLRLRSIAASLSFADQIQWREQFLPEHDMEDLFRDADLVVLPYRHIDQSGVLLQAMRFGVPVVASRVGQFEYYITRDVGELAKPGDVNELVDALERWAARRQDISRERIQGLAKAYEWTNAVDALRSAYE